MQKSIEERLKSLEEHAEFQHGNAIALQTVLVAALLTINRDAASRAYFVEILRGAAQGSFDHAIGQAWSDRVIAISRSGMAAIVGKDIAAEVGLP